MMAFLVLAVCLLVRADQFDRIEAAGQTQGSAENHPVSREPLAGDDGDSIYPIPYSQVDVERERMVDGTIALIVAAAIVSIFFGLLIRSTNSRNRQALEKIAFEDPVTGRSNYRRFHLDAEEILDNEDKARYGIWYCTIKDFGYINDFFGRAVGDSLLKYCADLFDDMTKDGEAFGRIYADSFVFLQRCTDMHAIQTRFADLARKLEAFPDTSSHGYKVRIYGGVYLLDRGNETLAGKSPSGAQQPPGNQIPDIGLADMIEYASMAESKARSMCCESNIGFYPDEMHERKSWEREVVACMESALQDGEFVFYLQPMIDISRNNRIAGAEALARWESPKHGLISPEAFIDLFERNGFIVRLDRYLFEQACRFYRETVLDTHLPLYVLSVNVSQQSLLQADFVASYAEIKESYRIPDGYIELEFMADMASESLGLLKDIVASLHERGFACSLDGFGSGCSSFSLLKSLAVDALKLDWLLFMRNGDIERSHILIRGIIELAHDLGIKTVAEGVDQESQIEALRTFGCDLVQGYVFSKPLPVGDFLRFLRDW